ncbi:MAG TPA: site-specific integrase [Planctomycetaceae bacterium]|nr:site-specific integrase [Planctomycetaceae bacterium]
MRRPNVDKQKIMARYFSWVVWNRAGTYYADGRGNSPKLGRYSLGTGGRSEALVNLERLDRQKAVDTGRADRSVLETESVTLRLSEGRELYETHIRRPAVTGGTRPATRKRYRAVLDKFLAFTATIGLEAWSQVNRRVLERYAGHLEQLGMSYNTQYLELTVLKQIMKWLIAEKHLPEDRRIQLPLPRDKESTAYCWAPAEFQAMVAHCRETSGLAWLADVLVALGFTGMRISELAQLRWSSVDVSNQMITLVDDSRQTRRPGALGLRTLKGKRNRSFPIHQDLLPVFQRMPHHRDGLVFHGPLGGRIKPDTLRNILIRQVLTPLKSRFPAPAGEQGFEQGRPHSFRHFFCSLCANSGVPERVVMDWLGHADAAMVHRYYHLDPQESRRQMDRVSIPVVTAGGVTSGMDVVPQETRSP